MTTITQELEAYLAIAHRDEERDYIGASSIGHPCERKIWYEYKGIKSEPITPSQYLIFETGNQLEAMLIDIMVLAGFNIITNKPATFLKDKLVTSLKGHCDVIWFKPQDLGGGQAIIEIKTARDKSFAIFAKDGLRAWNPQYYSQIQAYMGMSGIHEGYLLAINKDTCKLHDEKIPFDEAYFEEIRTKALRIMQHEEAPGRINQNPIFYMCKMCKFKEVCHG